MYVYMYVFYKDIFFYSPTYYQRDISIVDLCTYFGRDVRRVAGECARGRGRGRGGGAQ
jgi:hypothetical protein